MRLRLLALCLFAASLVAPPAMALTVMPPENGAAIVSDTPPVDESPSVNMTDNESATANTTAAVPQKGSEKGKVPPQLDPSSVFGKSVTILIELFVLAVVLESALALLFNWLPFQATFNSRGVKPLVSFAAALMLTILFQTEIFAKVVASYGGSLDHASDAFGRVIDAMVIAGGSSAVHNMLSKLGIRLPDGGGTTVAKPPVGKAWLAVVLNRDKSKGPVQVEIATVPAAGADPVWQICGTITGYGHVRGVARYFVRDYGRFPASGGWPVDPGVNSQLRLSGFDSAGVAIESLVYGELNLMPGAIVDIDLTL